MPKIKTTMKNKLGFALFLLLVAVFMGCKDDEEGKHHFSNQVFISATSFTDDVFIKRDNLDVTREESCDVTVAMAQPDRKSTRLNSSHITRSRMPSSA